MENAKSYDLVTDDTSPESRQANWEVAFGLQAVDGLRPSGYLRELAHAHIKGEKTYQEVGEELSRYYHSHGQNGTQPRQEEADEVSTAIYGILADAAFRFDIPTLQNYHQRLFGTLDKKVYHPGEFRTVNLTKKEAVLGGKSVQYQDFGAIRASLEYDFAEEAAQNYLMLTAKERVARMTTFVARIWQVHPFYEGNTRTTAVFLEKYLMSMGYQIDNELLGNYAKEFRDALVLANYTSIPDGIQADSSRLAEFIAKMMAQ